MKFRKTTESTEPMKYEKREEPVEMEKEENGLSDSTIYIDMDKLRPNDNNDYDISGIEELSKMIRLSGGIWQNIIVMPADEEGYHTITTGERRWRAAKLLSERGEYPEKFENKVPCTIRGLEEIKLPLSKENKENFAILVTNQYRSKKDSDIMMEMRKWRSIIGELRKAGVEYLPSVYSEDEVKIAGVPTRQLIASQLGVSNGQVARMERVENNGSEELIKRLLDDTMDLGAAEEMIKVSKEKQEKILGQLEKDESGRITKKAVTEKIREQEEKIIIQKQTLVDSFMDIADGVGEELQLNKTDYQSYQKLIKKLKELLS